MNRTATVLLTATLTALAFVGADLFAAGDDDVDPVVQKVVTQVERWPLWQHAELTTALRKKLDERLLTPGRKWLAQHEDLGGEGGVARIIYRGRYRQETWVRGGGAYYSFTTRSHDYNQCPDLELSSDGHFSSGFAGGDFGHVLELPAADLRKASIADVPEWMRESAKTLYPKSRRELRAEAKVRVVYAVRSVHEGRGDTLTVFEVLDIDEEGATIAWRVLERFPVWSRPRKR